MTHSKKVAVKTAIGASIACAGAFCCIKHVGLNVAAKVQSKLYIMQSALKE